MRRWVPLFDRDRVQNWLPGTLGISAAILLVVVAANSPTQTNSRPAELPPAQSTALASKDTPAPSPRAPPQTPAVTDKAAKAPTAAVPTPAVTTGDAAKPAPMHDHAMCQGSGGSRGGDASPLNSGEGSAKKRCGRRRGIARRHRRAPGLQEMSGVSFSGAGKDHIGSKPCRDRRPQVGRRC